MNSTATVHNVIIVGSGPAGYTAAIYLARAGLKPVVVAGALTPGGQLINTTEVENYPGFPDGVMGPDLMESMQRQAERFGAEIVFDDVESADLQGELKSVHLSGGQDLQTRTVIVATGSNYRHLNVPGELEYSGKGVSYCATCDGFFFRGKPIVVVGGGDCQLGMIGVDACLPGQAGVFGGSFWQYEFNTASPKTDDHCRVRVNCHAVPGVWQYEALAFKPGLVMRWFRDAFCQEEKRIAAESGTSAYDLMDERAAEVPVGAGGMVCCFSDIMNFIHWAHAAPTFTNFELDPDKYNKYTFYRAILENTALLVKGHIELVREFTGKEPDELVFAGGASYSDLWAQIVSDVTNKPVRVPVVKEATALGAAIIAGYGVGIYPSIAEGAHQVVKIEKTFSPDAANHAMYEKLYETWRKVYAAQLGLSEQGITKSMWSAPGIK